ncbi:MAG: hypothetical protein IJE03_02155, partial [Ruminiclostridium sp.]|nr:hypothetical protein [Ruminiclostridium sp.]
FMVIFLVWGFKDEVHAMLIEDPETCALCDQEPQEVPCLVDISTGTVGKLAGTNVSGTFQYIGVLGAMGGWDSDARSGEVTLPQESPRFLVPLFCRSCRWVILGHSPENYYLADLSDPSHPVLYPPEEGTCSLLGYDITVSEGAGGLQVTVKG